MNLSLRARRSNDSGTAGKAVLYAEQLNRRQYPSGRFEIMMQGREQVGRFCHDWNSGEARVIDIALLPEYRDA
jgi:hypothetical protein